MLLPALMLLLIAAKAHGQQTFSYFFDTGDITTIPLPTSAGSFDLDVGELTTGLHSFTAMVGGAKGLSPSVSALFLKTPNSFMAQNVKAVVMIDGGSPRLVDTSTMGNGAAFFVDATNLPMGIHSITSALISADGQLTDFASGLFFRVATRDENATMKAYYVIDDDPLQTGNATMTGALPTVKLDIDVAQLSVGLHSVTVYMASPLGPATQPIKAFFFKIPLGGEGIREYRYWVDKSDNIVKVKLDQPQLPFELVSMIEVPNQPFHSSDFVLRHEADGLAVYGVHQLYFMGIDGEFRTIHASHEFIESRIRIPVTDITELTIDGNSAKTDIIGPEKIKWYKLMMQTGDSLSLRTSSAAGIDVFGPDDERCYSAIGNRAINAGGFHAAKDGEYYIGVHDVINTSGITTLHYGHIERFAIIETSPKSTAPADMFLLNLTGNGLEHLKSVTISNGQGEEFESTQIRVDGYGRCECVFDLSGAPKGSYSIVANYVCDDESTTVTKNNSLSITDARQGEIIVKTKRTMFGTTLNDVTIRVTNTGNLPYWGVPLTIAAEVDGKADVKLNFKDFMPNMPQDDAHDWKMIFTDNLLGTGRRGGFLPMVLPYLGPNETKELTIVYQMPLQYHVPTYAWAGRPWSDEFAELESLAEQGKPFPEIINRNYISAQLMHLVKCVSEINSVSGSGGGMRAPACPVDISGVNNAVDLVERVGDRMGYDMSALGNAASVARTSVGIGNTIGGIVLGARLRVLDAQLSAYGIDLSSEEFSDLANYRSDMINSLPNPSRIARDTWGDDAGNLVDAMLGNCGGASETPTPMPHANDIIMLASYDPNDIIGYQSPSGDRHVGIDVKTMPYTIEFENDPELANAPAHVIRVKDCLDPEVFDLSSFSMRSIKIGDKTLNVEGDADFVRTLDMRPDIYAVAEIAMKSDKTSGEIEWTIRTLDPMSLEPATDVGQGVLPVNNFGEGCGEIQFDVDIKAGLKSGLKFGNKATIIFDSNDPIDTPMWENVIDYSRPESRIAEVTGNEGRYEFSIEASDTGAGLWTYELYYKPAGKTEWQLLRGNIPMEELVFESSDPLNDGSFCIVSTDGAGNRQLDTPMSVLLGDADGNGIVDSNDVVVIRNFFTSKTKEISKIAGDITLDYKIDAQDAIATRNQFLSRAGHLRVRKYQSKR